MNVGILGGGLVGLVVASLPPPRLRGSRARRQVSSHCCSFEYDGYTFDLGGPHASSSKNKEILAIIIEQLAGNVSQRATNLV